MITREKLRAPMRDKFLLNRIALNWNLLASEIAEVETVNKLKVRIDRQMTSNFAY